MKKLLVILALFVSSAFGETTGNLITSGTTHTWSGVTTGTLPANFMPGGPAPIYDPSTNTITFSYNANAYVGQVIAINQALANAGAGVKINGYNYSYDIRNMNGDNRQGGTDTLTVAQVLRGPNNSSLLSSSQYYNTKFEWQTITGTRTATTPIDMASATYLQIGITGGDNGYWAGYFGPQVRNVSMSLNYFVDPCVSNPAYSPSCAGFNNVLQSNNLVPNPTGYAQYGGSIDQSYAINQALQQSGANVKIHGFQWGYVANAEGPYCAGWFVVCWDSRTPSVTTNVDITDTNGNNIYSITRNYQNSYNTTNYTYLFPTTRNLLTLGSFNFTATTEDHAYVGSMWSKALYTPDPCTVNPLSSTTCPGYAQAYHDQQCSMNPLYASDCPGYAQAYFNQQCSANPLYNQGCPGFAQAYYNQQCQQNPLYDRNCPGYAQAYALKYVTPTTSSTTTTTSTTTTATVQTTDASTVAVPAVISDPVVNSVVTTTPSTTSATSPTSVTSVVAPAPVVVQTTSSSTTTTTVSSEKQEEQKQEQKKADSAVTATVGGKASKADPGAARAAATEKAKELANNMSKAASMEQQAASQGLLVGLIGYVPGFTAYQNSTVPDVNAAKLTRQYDKPVVDNRRAQRLMNSASDAKHQEMVDSQYNLGK